MGKVHSVDAAVGNVYGSHMFIVDGICPVCPNDKLTSSHSDAGFRVGTLPRGQSIAPPIGRANKGISSK